MVAHEQATANPVAFDPALAEMVFQVIRERRSNLKIDPDRPVPPALLDRLLELACWAPNHRRTHPWRFAIITGEGRARLGAVVSEALARLGEPPGKVEAVRTRYLRAPVMLVVGSAAHDDPILHRENRDAVAAGVQNILLAATALGLANYWATGSMLDDESLKRLVGLEPADQIVALIYLGWPLEPCPPTRREAPVVTYVRE